MDHGQEILDLKRRLDLAETKPAQQAGQFEFITGQLRDVQLYLHARFADVDQRFERVDKRLDRIDQKLEQHDGRFDKLEARFDRLDSKVDALPRVIAEMIAQRG